MRAGAGVLGPVVFVTVMAVALKLPAGAVEEEAPRSPEEIRAENRKIVERRYQQALKRYKGKEEFMVRRGLVADREGKEIRVLAEATGLDKSGSPPEFFIISEDSGHDYEALSISFADPLDVHQGLEFIGMTPGRPVDPAELMFWPKGERVLVTVECDSCTEDKTPVKIERLLVEAETGKPASQTGLVFTGSAWIESRTNGQVYAANAVEPRSIAANYNEPYTVLDVPRVAPQGQVYRTYDVNPEYVFPVGALLELKLEPEYPGDKKRVVDIALKASREPGKGLTFLLKKEEGARTRLHDLSKVVAYFEKLGGDGHDPFVTVAFADELKLGTVREISSRLAALETPRGIRVEPPPEGQLYYKAFLPRERFRKRKKRPVQPWELHLERTEKGGVGGRLVRIDQVWQEGKVWPELQINEYPVAGGAELDRTLQEKKTEESVPVIVVYAEKDVLYGDLMGFMRPVLAEYPTVHVFTGEEEAVR